MGFVPRRVPGWRKTTLKKVGVLRIELRSRAPHARILPLYYTPIRTCLFYHDSEITLSSHFSEVGVDKEFMWG